LELLRNGAQHQIVAAVREIAKATEGRRHIIGQADSTILEGTPPENIRTFLEAVESLGNER
jgi:uroporphyrinogen-III decarboxylase